MSNFLSETSSRTADPGLPRRRNSIPFRAAAHFSLTQPYGWLPGLAYPTTRSTNVYLTRIYEPVIFAPASGPVGRFNAFPAGDCHVQAGKLNCKPAQFIGFLGTSPRLGRRVGTIDGSP